MYKQCIRKYMYGSVCAIYVGMSQVQTGRLYMYVYEQSSQQEP